MAILPGHESFVFVWHSTRMVDGSPRVGGIVRSSSGIPPARPEFMYFIPGRAWVHDPRLTRLCPRI